MSKVPARTQAETVDQIYENRQLALQINSEHAALIADRDAMIETGKRAVARVLRIGAMLELAKKRFSGMFDEWLKCSLDFAPRTAYRYLKCYRRHSAALSEGVPDFQCLKDLYIACEVLPDPIHGKQQNGETDAFIGFWNTANKITHWLPRIEDKDKPRLREWWLAVGAASNFIGPDGKSIL